VVRVHTEYGPEAARKGVLRGMLFGTRRVAGVEPLGDLDPSLFVGALADSPRAEVRVHRGEPLLLSWYAHTDGEAVRALTRLTTDGDRVARLRNYFYTPDVIAEVCRELGVPFRVNGTRYWKRLS
jgi:RNA polymerase sigma-70 factor, ECF subfamily